MDNKYTKTKNYFYKNINSKQIRIFTNQSLFNNLNKESIKQLEDISQIKEIESPIIGLSDMHIGYGVPIGSTFITDAKKGIISCEAVGFDINCGVRLIKTNLFKEDLEKINKKELFKELRKLPLGLSNNGLKITYKELDEILKTGINWAIKNNYEKKDNQKFIEVNGFYKNANPEFISKLAKKRGKDQIGTLGKGNHFIDIMCSYQIFSEKYSKEFGIKKNQIFIMIHSGSRGLGHQVGKDYIAKFENKNQITYQKINTKLGKEYYSAMLSAANFAYVNRAILNYFLESKLKLFFNNLKTSLVYDLCHNIAQFEKINNKKYLVHRKGATRIRHKEEFNKSNLFSKTSAPIILPGSMTDFSYLLYPLKKGSKNSLNTVAHGLGRSLSRTKAKQEMSYKQLTDNLETKKIYHAAGSENTAREEQPKAYKQSKDVISSLESLSIAKRIVSLKPIYVLTG